MVMTGGLDGALPVTANRKGRIWEERNERFNHSGEGRIVLFVVLKLIIPK